MGCMRCMRCMPIHWRETRRERCMGDHTAQLAVCAAVWAPTQTRNAYTPTRAYLVTTLPQTRSDLVPVQLCRQLHVKCCALIMFNCTEVVHVTAESCVRLGTAISLSMCSASLASLVQINHHIINTIISIMRPTCQLTWGRVLGLLL